jgi:hypothetical protein
VKRCAIVRKRRTDERLAQTTVNKIVTVLFEQGGDTMIGRVTAWQCIGCGRIEGAQSIVETSSSEIIEWK